MSPEAEKNYREGISWRVEKIDSLLSEIGQIRTLDHVEASPKDIEKLRMIRYGIGIITGDEQPFRRAAE